MATADEATRKPIPRLWWWLAGVLLAWALLGGVVAPMVLRQQLMPLLQQRLGDNVSLGRIRINPFTLAATIESFDLRDGQGERLLAFDTVYANLALFPLLEGTVQVQQLWVDGLYVGVHRYSETDTNIARLLAHVNDTAPVAPAAPPSKDEPAMPRIDILLLELTGASIGYVDEVPAVPFRTHVEAVDIAITNLSTVPESEAADQSFTLALGDGTQLRWRGDISIAPIASSGDLQLFGPVTELAYRYFQEQIPVVLDGGWFDAGLDYEFSLGNDGAPQLRLRNMQVSLSNLDILSPENGELLARLPTLALSGGDLDLARRQVQFNRLQLADFDIRPTRYSDGSINFLRLLPETEQETAAATADAGSDSSPWDLRITETAVERWRIQLRDEVPQQPVAVALGLNVRATNISNRANAPINVDTDISLGSGGRLRAGGALTVLPTPRYDGEFTLENLALPVVQPYLQELANIHLDSGVLRAEGNVSYAPTQSGFSGALALEGLGITDTGENEALFGIDSLQVEAINLRTGEQTSVDVGAIRLTHPYARVEIEADGSTNIGRVMRPDSGEPETLEETPEPAAPTPLPPVRIDQVVISGASADFSDRSLPLPFAVHMDALGGEISAISSQSTEPARVMLEGQVDEFGLASISGRLRPLDFASLTEIDLSFRNLDIPSLSPYMIKFAGRRIDDGDLDVDLSYRIQERQLQGDNAMVMRDLVLGERVPHPDALDLPLGLAIALLKDRNGVIDLAVPVTGDLDNPQFSYGSVISTALANIIRNIVTSPFRFLAGLVGGGEDDDFGVIAFMPGRSDLLPPEREKLLKLGSALIERPQLQLDLTGVYERTTDREAMQQNVFDARVGLALDAARQAAEDARALAEAQVAVAERPETIPVPAIPTATELRRQVLERFYRQSAVDLAAGEDAEAFLTSQRAEFTSQEGQLDETAYLESLRRALIAREPITQADLERLAQERLNAIVTALSGLDATLAPRLQAHAESAAVTLEAARVPMELSLSAINARGR
ncbi:MAG: DUF748 domain-containing protein [Pseudomonadales bacterium]|nr:DUF748 domain-containing protein [Pseudomonadales bacterium]